MRIPEWLASCAPRTAPRALAWFVVLSIAFTWPVAAGLDRDVPRDLGDPLLNCWILGWNASHFLDFLKGNWGALDALWHGNIFHPERYTLGYSELLLAQAVQILPVYAITGNLILCYNLLFISTFFLSGLGMYLLVRAYTGDWRAAFLAGLLFAFAPYRVNQGPHLQVMSSQWMPFAFYGFHRFVEIRRLSAVVGGALALIAQNLSCGYFLIFFSLFVPPFVLFEIWRGRAWGDWRTWSGFALAAVLVAAVTLPAMRPYTALRALQDSRRSATEIGYFSADAWGWLSADDNLRFWGPRLRLFVRPEGQLFPGLLPIALAVIGVAGGAIRSLRKAKRAPSQAGDPPASPARRWATMLSLAVLTVAVVLSGIVLTGLRAMLLESIPIPIVRFENLLMAIGISFALLLMVSDRARTWARWVSRSPLAFAACCAAIAWYLSLGPDPQAGGHSIHGPRLYRELLEDVPGFDGLRVPARFAMLVTFFLSLVAGWGVRTIVRHRSPRTAALLVTVLAVAWMGEAWSAPVPLNGVLGSTIEGVGDPPSRVPTGVNPPALARYLRTMPAATVLLELPFGAGGWEMRYVYYSTFHWRRLVNGFSGYAPKGYLEQVEALKDPLADPDLAWRHVIGSGATHIVVHGQAFAERTPPAPYSWLESKGARLITSVGGDEIYEVPR